MIESYESTDASLVLTLEEITSLTQEEGKPADTLMNVVALIAARFRTDVCSAYLLEPDRSNLVLAATLGLHPRCIGKLRMPLSPGNGDFMIFSFRFSRRAYILTIPPGLVSDYISRCNKRSFS